MNIVSLVFPAVNDAVLTDPQSILKTKKTFVSLQKQRFKLERFLPK